MSTASPSENIDVHYYRDINDTLNIKQKKEKLTKIKSSVDNKAPKRHNHLRKNLKREQLQEEVRSYPNVYTRDYLKIQLNSDSPSLSMRIDYYFKRCHE